MKKLLTLLTTGLMTGLLSAAVPIPEPATNIYGKLRGNETVITNQLQINQAIVENMNDKLNKMIFDEGFDAEAVCYQATLAESSQSDHVAPPVPYVYLTELSLQANIYDSEKKKCKRADEGGFSMATAGDQLLVQAINSLGNLDTWTFTSMPVTGSVLKVSIPEKKSYDYSHPYDWNIFWTALDDPDTETIVVTSFETNSAGPIITTTTQGVIKNNKAKLYINYFDEVNVPPFTFLGYEVVDGPATIKDDILTATQSGIVTVKAKASNDGERLCDIPMYQWRSTTSTSRYQTDSEGTTWAANRKRVNDWMLNLLQTYRSNPTTNYHYTTWGDPSANHHYSNPGDRFTGEFGKRFHPYAHHGVSSSGENGFWWAHAPISKHVLLAAAHYGDYNFNRFLNGTEYFNWNGEFSGKKAVRVRRWYYLSQWAAEHGFEGSDAQCGDLAFWVIDPADEIPDECLPYIATADWLNANFGVDIVNYPGTFKVPTVMLNQAAMVSVRGMITGTCGSSATPPYKGATWYDDNGSFIENYESKYFRLDIAKMIGLGGWHDGVLGDSGKPTYLYDPNYTTGLTDTDGQPLLRPIILHPTTWASGGSSGSVPRHAKVVKAFVEWVGDTLPYVLGDIDHQSTDTEVIKQHAIEAMGGHYNPPNEN